MKIILGDILEMKNGKAYEVLEGESQNGIDGELTLIEVDENNYRIGEPFGYKLKVNSQIIDIIR